MQAQKNICLDFKIQVRSKDEQRLGIKDATAVWEEKNSPFITVAKITIPSPQKIDSPENVKVCEDRIFNPWNALVSHEPLGSINRLRKYVYLASEEHRSEKNRCPAM